MLQIRDLDVSYGRIRALTRVSFDVQAGEIVTLIGPNGAGKSTLLKTVAGILKPQAGTIRFAGEPIHGRRAEDIVPRGLMLVPEGRSTLKHMTVHENLILGGYVRRDQAGLAQDIERMIDRFPALRPRLGQKAGTLSGGEQQMLVIARALLARPSLLMLDEPSLGLAPLVTAKIFSIIRELKEDGVTVLLVEQNARQALRLADRAYVLENGRIVLEGADLAGNDRVREAYLGV